MSPNSIFSNVVFPAPFGPSTPYTSPDATFRDTSATARTVPNDLHTAAAATASLSLIAGTLRTDHEASMNPRSPSHMGGSAFTVVTDTDSRIAPTHDRGDSRRRQDRSEQ